MKKIFYSWQSDLPGHRNFLQRCLEGAIQDTDFEIETATRNSQGAIDISASILSKIAEADMFLADISIVNHDQPNRQTPNPNVLYELGYAVGKKGEGPIILVVNSDTTEMEKLPFDIRNRQIMKISFSRESQSRISTEIKRIISEHNPQVEELSAPGITLSLFSVSNNSINFIATNDESYAYILEAIEYGGGEQIISRRLAPQQETSNISSSNLPSNTTNPNQNIIKFYITRQQKTFRIHQHVYLEAKPDGTYSLARIEPNPIKIEAVPKWRPAAEFDILPATGADSSRVQFEDVLTRKKFVLCITNTVLALWPGTTRDENMKYFLRIGNAINRKMMGNLDAEVTITSFDSGVDFETLIDKIYTGELHISTMQ